MKIIVTHSSPDLDAIGSVWVIKKFLPGWQDAKVEFVPAGKRLERVKNHPDFETKAILEIGGDEIMHVDTGLGPLDHHQTSDMNTCGAMRSWEYALSEVTSQGQSLKNEHSDAASRIMSIIVDYDHFQEVYKPEAASDYHDFSFYGINEGLQYLRPGQDDHYMEFGRTCLDYLFSSFENKIWAEKELKNGIEFETRFGKCLGIESLNDSVVKLAQKKGYVLVVRKDSKRGNAVIKTIPHNKKLPEDKGIDLTLAYEQLNKMDPDATWYLHVSKKMLLNGSKKDPNMKPTRLKLQEVISVLERLYK